MSTDAPARGALNDITGTANRSSAVVRADDVAAVDLTGPDSMPGSSSGALNAFEIMSGKKRKSTSDEPAAVSAPVDLDFDDDEDSALWGPPTQNCDQVRRKITRLIDSGEMKVGQFCDAINVNNNALNRFRGQSGAFKGDRSDVYVKASNYFDRRERAGVKLPNKNKKQKTAAEGSGGKGKAAAHPDISGITLPDEESDGVPVYETCDEIRKKIGAYLRKPEVTQAQFCRDIHAQCHASKRTSRIQSSQLDRFRNNKGPRAGNTSCVFYASYVFFEKVRIAEGKAKSKHRETMEKKWPQGFDTERPAHMGYTCVGDERPHVDQFDIIAQAMRCRWKTAMAV